MTKSQHDYLLTYLRSFEDRIEGYRSELQTYSALSNISVSSITSIATNLHDCQVEQRAVCYTLGRLGYYVVYKDGHAENIVVDE